MGHHSKKGLDTLTLRSSFYNGPFGRLAPWRLLLIP